MMILGKTHKKDNMFYGILKGRILDLKKIGNDYYKLNANTLKREKIQTSIQEPIFIINN